MITRRNQRFPQILEALLYGGPLLAGMAGQDWAGLAAFALFAFVHGIALRRPDLATPAGQARAGLILLRAALFSTLAWGLGLSLGKAGLAIALPLWAPMALSAVAAGLASWAFRDSAQMDVMLDSTIAALRAGRLRPAEPWPTPAPGVETALAQVLRELRQLDAPSPGLVDPIIQHLARNHGAAAFDAFYDAAGSGAAVDMGLLRFCRCPVVERALVARGEAGLAPHLLAASPDPGVRAEAQALIAHLVETGVSPAQLPAPMPAPQP